MQIDKLLEKLKAKTILFFYVANLKKTNTNIMQKQFTLGDDK